MQTTASLTIDGAAVTDVFEQVALLDRYPAWMRLVHRVEPLEPDGGRPAWRVELRARVGPLARSKQLRMVRTVHEPPHRVRFERIQDDERDHAEWVLTATVEPVDRAEDPVSARALAQAAGGARLITDLRYSGKLWGTAILERVLEEEIKRGKDALTGLVSVEPTR